MSEIPGPDVAVSAPGAGPAGTDGHADGGQLVFGLDYGGCTSAVRSDSVLLEKLLRVFGQAARRRDRIPGQHADSAKKHAERRGLVALDQDLVLGRLHALNLKRQIAGEVGAGPLKTGPGGADVDLASLGLAARKLAADSRLDRLELDPAHCRQDSHVDHVDDFAELVAVPLIGFVGRIGLFHEFLEWHRKKADIVAKLREINVEIVAINAD